MGMRKLNDVNKLCHQVQGEHGKQACWTAKHMSFLLLLGLLMARWPKMQGLALGMLSTKLCNEKTVASVNKLKTESLLTDLIPATLIAVMKTGD